MPDETVPRLTAREFLFSFRDPWHPNRVCSHFVQIFVNDSWNTIIMTDRSSQFHCASITNTVELCAAALLADPHLPELDLKPIIWIEHYDEHPEEWDLVSFGKEFRHLVKEPTPIWAKVEPKWKRISRKEAEDWAGTSL